MGACLVPRRGGAWLAAPLLLALLLAAPTPPAAAYRHRHKHRHQGSKGAGASGDLPAKRPINEVWGGPLQVLLVAREATQGAAHEVIKSVVRHRPDANVTVGCLDAESLSYFERLEDVQEYLIGKKHKGSSHKERHHQDLADALKEIGSILQGGVDVMYLDNTLLWTGDVIEAVADHPYDVIVPHGERESLQDRRKEDEAVLGASLVVLRASEKTVRWVRRWRAVVQREGPRSLPLQAALSSLLRLDEFNSTSAMSPESRDVDVCPGQGPQDIENITIVPKFGLVHSSARLRGEGAGNAAPAALAHNLTIHLGVLPYSLYPKVCRDDLHSNRCDLRATSEVVAVMCPTDEGGAHTAQVAQFLTGEVVESDVNGPGEERPMPAAGDWMEGARQSAIDAAAAIAATYGENADEVLGSLHFLNETYIVGKLGRLLMKPRDVPLEERRFVVSFQGTSVTAGHDNLYTESYPLVFERELQKPFSLAGIDLMVRNMAMGNNPPVPSSFCVASQLGLDTDVAVWEFGMMVAGPPTWPMTETWIRNVISMPRKPAVMLVDPGEGPRKVDEAKKQGPRKKGGRKNQWRDHYNGHGTNLFDYYKDFGVHYQAMFEAVWYTDTKAPYDYYTLMEADKKSEQRAPWHMGPHAHEMRGKILAHGYLKLLERALTLAIDALKGDMPSVPEFAQSDPVVPEPKGCDAQLCGLPQRCMMTYEPKAEGWDLVEAIIKPKDVAKERVVKSLPNDKWHVQLFETDHDAVKKVLDQNLGYLDMKWVLQGNSDAGPLEFRVETTVTGRLFICQPPGLWGKLPDSCTTIDEGSEVRVSGKLMEWEDVTFYEQHKLDKVTCKTFKEPVKGGSHMVQVTPKVGGDKYIAVSAVVYVHD